MKVIGFIGAVFTFVFFANLAYAADMSIDMLNKDADGNRMVYSNELAKVAVGDTITWLPASKGHNVEIIAAPDGYDIPKKSKNGKEVSIDWDKVQTKAIELQTAFETKEKNKETKKTSAITKLKALGLDDDEINALMGN